MVAIARRLQAEKRLQQAVQAGRRLQIGAADHIGDGLGVVVEDAGDVI